MKSILLILLSAILLSACSGETADPLKSQRTIFSNQSTATLNVKLLSTPRNFTTADTTVQLLPNSKFVLGVSGWSVGPLSSLVYDSAVVAFGNTIIAYRDTNRLRSCRPVPPYNIFCSNNYIMSSESSVMINSYTFTDQKLDSIARWVAQQP
jgi:hypothetical protein